MTRIDDEIEFHIEMLIRELIENGMTADDARAEALRRFGDAKSVRRRTLARNGTATLLTMLGLVLVTCSFRLLWLVPAYRTLHEQRPYYVAESLKNILEVGVCIALLLLMQRRNILHELKLDGRILPAAAFGVAAAWPMLIGFAITNRSHITDAVSVAYLAFFSPFVEELVMRGFAFGSLRASGWPLWPAAIGCALVTAIAHIEKGQTTGQILGLFAVTGAGGLTFCWIVERWQSIWFSFALHALMDFSWEVFNVAPTALGGWYPFILQNACVLLAILITLRMTPRRRALDRGEGDNASLGTRPPTDGYSRSRSLTVPATWSGASPSVAP